MGKMSNTAIDMDNEVVKQVEAGVDADIKEWQKIVEELNKEEPDETGKRAVIT